MEPYRPPISAPFRRYGRDGRAQRAQGRRRRSVAQGFAPVERTESDQPAAWFKDPAYYKTILSGEGEEAKRVHEILGKLLKSHRSRRIRVYSQQIVPAYWYLASKVALHSIGGQSPPSPRKWPFALARYCRISSRRKWSRYSIELFSKNHRRAGLLRRRMDARPGCRAGQRERHRRGKAAGADRGRQVPGSPSLIQRAQGKRDASEGIMKAKAEERRQLESLLKERVESICESPEAIPACFTYPRPIASPKKRA